MLLHDCEPHMLMPFVTLADVSCLLQLVLVIFSLDIIAYSLYIPDNACLAVPRIYTTKVKKFPIES
jgi:hypothetical protein